MADDVVSTIAGIVNNKDGETKEDDAALLLLSLLLLLLLLFRYRSVEQRVCCGGGGGCIRIDNVRQQFLLLLRNNIELTNTGILDDVPTKLTTTAATATATAIVIPVFISE